VNSPRLFGTSYRVPHYRRITGQGKRPSALMPTDRGKLPAIVNWRIAWEKPKLRASRIEFAAESAIVLSVLSTRPLPNGSLPGPLVL